MGHTCHQPSRRFQNSALMLGAAQCRLLTGRLPITLQGPPSDAKSVETADTADHCLITVDIDRLLVSISFNDDTGHHSLRCSCEESGNLLKFTYLHGANSITFFSGAQGSGTWTMNVVCGGGFMVSIPEAHTWTHQRLHLLHALARLHPLHLRACFHTAWQQRQEM